MSRRLISWFVLLALCASCQKFAEGRQMFRELLSLRDDVVKEFHEANVDVNLMNGNRMKVVFTNSAFQSQSNEEKQKRADAVAAFVAAHYKHPLASVTTVFVKQSGGMGVSVSSSEAFVGRMPAKP